MSWDDDDFERELMSYSEIETAKARIDSVPQTIQSYHHRIQANNNASIFDRDFSLPVADGVRENGKVNDNLFNDDQVIKFTSGRGRGGRNLFHRPGDFNRKDDDEQAIIQRIRTVAPVGYGNEVTENSIRAHQISKMGDPEKSVQSSPMPSASNSPHKHPEHDSLPSLVRATSQLKITPSTASSSSSQVSESESSDYFTSQDFISSPEKSSDENKNNCSSPALQEVNESEQAKENIKPKSICEMLKSTREKRRQLILEQQRKLESENASRNDMELASQRRIKEILRQDYLEKLKQKQSENSRDGALSWRQRESPPPTSSWQYSPKRKKMLNINSTHDFPPLK